MDNTQILKEFDLTFSEFEAAISKFNPENFNKSPFEESWTAAQVVQHILLSIENFPSIFNGKTEATSRPYDALVPTLKDIFLNLQTKMKSPDFIKPKLQTYDLLEQLAKVKRSAAEIKLAVKERDLSKTCLDFQFPSLGFLTALEAIYFIIYHTQRHTHQLNEIHQLLN